MYKEIFGYLDEVLQDPSYRNIFRVICGHGEVVAAEYLENGEIKKRTYQEYKALASGAAEALQQKQLPKGVIGLKAETTPDWPILLWACLMAGHVPLLLNTADDAQAITKLLTEGGAVGIVADDALAYGEYPLLRTAELLANKAASTSFAPDWADQIAVCTSGTSSDNPQIFVYDGAAMAMQLNSSRSLLLAHTDIVSAGEMRVLVGWPLQHVFGCNVVYMWHAVFGKTLVYPADHRLETILSTCQTLRVTHIYGAPSLYDSLVRHIRGEVRSYGASQEKSFLSRCDQSMRIQGLFAKKGPKIIRNNWFPNLNKRLLGTDLRYLVSLGGRLKPKTMQLLTALGLPLHNSYGLTEAGLVFLDTSYPLDERLSGSCGKPVGTVSYQLAENDELLINGPSLYSGMLCKGAYIPRDSHADGWFSTGDLCHVEEGRLYLDGRLADVIVDVVGENIYPDELEDRFSLVEGVSHYTVLGIDFGSSATEIVLAVNLAPTLQEENLPALCADLRKINANLPFEQQISKVIVCKEELPMTKDGNIQRQVLKQQIEKGECAYALLDLASAKLNDVRQKADTLRLATLQEEVRAIFADVLVLGKDQVGDDDHFIFDLGGSSLSVLEMETRIEEAYQIFIPSKDYEGLSTVRQITGMLYRQLSGEAADAPPAFEPDAEVTERITDFTETPEYKEFAARYEQTACTEYNPYFVAHDSAVRDTSVIHGKETINLGSYNYLGLSGDPETVEAACAAARAYGTSASGSRVLAGEKTLYQQLEETIAKWKHTEDAIVLPGGYATNVTIVGNFCGKGDLILYDALSHNSIFQGCQLSAAETRAFPHNDIAALESILRNVEGRFRKVLLIVEGVYSMDGDIAPIPEFIRLKKQYKTFLMVDEAHSSGVIGENGGGVDDYFQLAPEDIDIKMGTLSKALGTCGGYLAGRKELITYLKYCLPGFVFTAGISPVLAAACKKSVEMLMTDHQRVQQLRHNIELFIHEAKKRGFDTYRAAESAIVPIMIGDDSLAFKISAELLARGVFIPPAVYPAVPVGESRLRVSLTAIHTDAQLFYALDRMEEVFHLNHLM